MVTVLDVSLLGTIGFIFPVLIVWAIIFALLQKTEWVTKSVGINVTIASAIALSVLLSPKLIEFLNFIVPWFAVAIIFFVLLLLVFRIFGAEEKNFQNAVINDKALLWTLIGVGLLILISGIFSTIGQDITDLSFQGGQNASSVDSAGVSSASFQQNIYGILFHPKILGVIVVFTIMVFAVALLTGSEHK